MALQRVPPEGEKQGLAPSSIEGGRDVEEERDEGADVLHRDGLRVEVQKRGGLVLGDGVVVGAVAVGGDASRSSGGGRFAAARSRAARARAARMRVSAASRSA